VGAPKPLTGTESILIVRLSAIGDVTNSLTVASAIRSQHPQVKIAWAIHELSRPLVDGHPAVDRVHLWPRRGGLGALAMFLREVRAEHYDLAIDLQCLAKSGIVSRLSGARRVLGFDRRRAKEGSWLFTRERIARGDPDAHMIEQYQGFLRHLEIDSTDVIRELPADPEADAWANEQLSTLGGAPIQINMGASKIPNRWAPERIADLVRACRTDLKRTVVLTGGPEDRDWTGTLLADVGGEAGVLDLVGRTSLPQLIAVSRAARLFVGCDTGPMHLAAAVGTPVVALFGPADPRRTGPYGDGHRLVRGPDGGRGPMDGITVEQVVGDIRAVVEPGIIQGS